MYNTEGLVSVREAIRNLEDQITDLRWEDPNSVKANVLEMTLEYYKRLEKEGTLYVPDF